MMNWKPLDSEQKVMEIIELSKIRPQIILKHSISCPVSSMAKIRIERSPIEENVDYYLLDLWNHRPVSDLVAHKFGVSHESPQILVIKDGACVYHESHYSISPEKIANSTLLFKDNRTQ